MATIENVFSTNSKMKPVNLIDTAAEKALGVLERCLTPIGIKASALSNGYTQVWARDSSITYLGSVAFPNHSRLMRGYRESLETLATYQTELGYIPNNVDSTTRKVYTFNSGSIDSNSWFIISVYNYYLLTKETKILERMLSKIEKAFLWLRHQDSNADGLLEHLEGATWADLLSNRHQTLYANVLYYGATICLAKIYRELRTKKNAISLFKQADFIKRQINTYFWIDAKKSFVKRKSELDNVYYIASSRLNSFPYYLPFLSFRDYADYCDVLGNLLAILFGIASDHQAQAIFKYIESVGIDQPFPVKAIFPPIFPGEKEWRDYYKWGNLNLPYQYHNAGIWPFIGGFYVLTLEYAGKRDQARSVLERLAEANHQGYRSEWEFNEWLHGETGKAMGVPFQAWSAGMYCAAYTSVIKASPSLFEQLKK